MDHNVNEYLLQVFGHLGRRQNGDGQSLKEKNFAGSFRKF